LPVNGLGSPFYAICAPTVERTSKSVPRARKTHYAARNKVRGRAGQQGLEMRQETFAELFNSAKVSFVVAPQADAFLLRVAVNHSEKYRGLSGA